MKKQLLISLILTSLLFSTMSLFAQQSGKLTINVSQDARLAIIGDDKGNEAFTANVRIRSEWRGKQSQDTYIAGINVSGFLFVAPEFEVADLKGGTFRRYSVNAGYTFNRVIENLGMTTSIGYGITDYNIMYRGFSADFELSYDFGGIEMFVAWQLIDRKELGEVRGSGFIGLKKTL